MSPQPPLSSSSSSTRTMSSRQTFCHRYLSRIAGISAETIDIMVINGFDSVYTLRALDMDRDWHLIPPQISLGQKILLRQALAKLPDDVAGDDDYNSGDNHEMTTSRRSVSNSRVFINLDDNNDKVLNNNNNGKPSQDVNSDNQFCDFYDDLTVPSNSSDFDLKRLSLQTQPVVLISPLKMPTNGSKTIGDSRLNWSDIKSNSNNPLKCGHCDRYLSSADKLEIHVNSRHLKCRPFRCNKCRKGFFSNISLLNHLGEKHAIRPFGCDKCQFKGWTKWHLVKHMFIHSNNRPHVCDYNDCNQSFKRKDYLRIHQKRIHLTKRKFVCNYNGCDQSFKCKDYLRRHNTRVHTTDQEFVCNYDDCNQSFKAKEYLRIHKKTVHSIDQSFVCNYKDCDKSFKARSYLRQHERMVHLTNKRLVCDYDDCDKSFISARTLHRHQKIVHSTDRPFVCNYENCDMSFKRKDYLIYHQKKVHLLKVLPNERFTISSANELTETTNKTSKIERHRSSTGTIVTRSANKSTKTTAPPTTTPSLNQMFTQEMNEQPVITDFAADMETVAVVDIKPLSSLSPIQLSNQVVEDEEIIIANSGEQQQQLCSVCEPELARINGFGNYICYSCDSFMNRMAAEALYRTMTSRPNVQWTPIWDDLNDSSIESARPPPSIRPTIEITEL
ncbi:zinc finger protein 239-like [Oppia nitens]|uniref:zinc finger protein 239-like n=1 Tax=Oppia nitens TaxID=1686743 RepID=UPI0023DB0D52|nr:zinc finger protein 239-like [Oppia nitens]